MRALILVALVLLAPVLADPAAEARQVAVAFREAFARAKQPEELFPYMSRGAIAAVETNRKNNPADFAKVWELAHLLSATETVPRGARVIDELTVKGERASYVTGYSLKTRESSSTVKQTTELVREDGKWKVDFRMEAPKISLSMEQNHYIAFLLFFVALVDLPLGFLVAQRVEPPKRPILMLAFVMSSLIIGGLGVAFYLKLIG